MATVRLCPNPEANWRRHVVEPTLTQGSADVHGCTNLHLSKGARRGERHQILGWGIFLTIHYVSICVSNTYMGFYLFFYGQKSLTRFHCPNIIFCYLFVSYYSKFKNSQ